MNGKFRYWSEMQKKKVIFNKTRFVEINDLFITMADFFNFFDEHKLPHHMN